MNSPVTKGRSAAREEFQQRATQIGFQSPLFRQTNWALFSAGFTVFSLLYFVQSLLPVFSRDFGVTPAQSSLVLSTTTGVLAFALLVSGIVSDVVGRKRLMLFSLVTSALATIVMALMPSWWGVVGVRIFMGISLSGVQAAAMAYLAEEMEPRAFGVSLGLFISGSAIGGMAGRLLVSVIADHADWRVATATMGLIGLGASLYFWKALPSSRHFVRRSPGMHAIYESLAGILRDPVFLLLCLVGFLLMGSFVTTYNYVTYRLVEPPFALSQTFVGLVFLVYLVGIAGPTFIGHLASRHGHAAVLWGTLVIMLAGLLATVPDKLVFVLGGLAVLTFGFFSGHSVASGWVSYRAKRDRALAASVYLFAYYQGSSVFGTVGGVFWQHGRWPAVVALTAGLTVSALAVAIGLRHSR